MINFDDIWQKIFKRLWTTVCMYRIVFIVSITVAADDSFSTVITRLVGLACIQVACKATHLAISLIIQVCARH